MTLTHLESLLPAHAESIPEPQRHYAALPRFVYHGVPTERGALNILRRGILPAGGETKERVFVSGEEIWGVFLGLSSALSYACGTRGGRRVDKTGAAMVFEIDTRALDSRLLVPYPLAVLQQLAHEADEPSDAILAEALRKGERAGDALHAAFGKRMEAGEWSAATHPAMVARSMAEWDEIVYRAPVPLAALSRCLTLPADFHLEGDFAGARPGAPALAAKLEMMQGWFNSHGQSLGEARRDRYSKA